MRLDLMAGFFGSVKGAIEEAEVVFANVALSAWPLRCENKANLIEVFGIYGLAIEIPLPELNAHGS